MTETSLAHDIAGVFGRLFEIVGGKTPVAPTEFPKALASISKVHPETKNVTEALRLAELSGPEDKGMKVTDALKQINRIGFTQPELAMDLLYAARNSSSVHLKERSLVSFMEYALQTDIDESVNMASIFGRVSHLILHHAENYDPASQLILNMKLAWLASGDKALETAGADSREIILNVAETVLRAPDFRDTAAAFLNANGRPVWSSDGFGPLTVITRDVASLTH